ncbi:hypothetical protein GF359_01210 [candidate division WOR-3 bacterium]|uniref:DUF3098 domain-containing protein n=1 Tax=candidate division WOR-3 bacterium TaxID=2052148 RepID=A0A9D5K7L4_UNCW3|nr:hypothetical protein [candidate division WOR-3 bacterium]MBD3363813.1 hypothetical protein [candidate division WOR-3 bacterium]
MNVSKKKKKDKGRMNVVHQSPRYNYINWLLLLAGVISIGLGFWFLHKGSITLAPILMVLGYCVIVPLALLLRIPKSGESKKADA